MAALRKEVVALQIMKVNYEQIVKAHQNQPGNAALQVSDEVKFQVVMHININNIHLIRHLIIIILKVKLFISGV